MDPELRTLDLKVNGVRRSMEVEPGSTLLDVLRRNLGLTGTKEACSRGECGACTVLVGDDPIMSCVTLAETITEEIMTIEGVIERTAELRAAFADHGAFQCGYCTPGQIMRMVSLLRGPIPDPEQRLREAISGNICRCTGYDPIVSALRAAANGEGQS